MRLSLRDVSLSYQGGTHLTVQALSGVSLEIDPGERLGVIGPVGAGKSSLLAVLAGLVPPDTGAVVHGNRVLGAKTGPEPGSVGLAFQAPERCLFGKTVLEDVAFAPRHTGSTEAEAQNQARRALIQVGLEPEGFAGRSPFSLSTGEQRRVALAGVLAMEPRALLLDEPTAHLDPVTRRDLTERLLDLNHEAGTTIVIVSHDMDEISRFAQRAVVIDAGRVAADGETAQLLNNAALLERHSLEPPGVVALSLLLSQATGLPAVKVRGEDDAVAALMAALSGGGPACD